MHNTNLKHNGELKTSLLGLKEGLKEILTYLQNEVLKDQNNNKFPKKSEFPQTQIIIETDDLSKKEFKALFSLLYQSGVPLDLQIRINKQERERQPELQKDNTTKAQNEDFLEQCELVKRCNEAFAQLFEKNKNKYALNRFKEKYQLSAVGPQSKSIRSEKTELNALTPPIKNVVGLHQRRMMQQQQQQQQQQQDHAFKKPMQRRFVDQKENEAVVDNFEKVDSLPGNLLSRDDIIRVLRGEGTDQEIIEKVKKLAKKVDNGFESSKSSKEFSDKVDAKEPFPVVNDTVNCEKLLKIWDNLLGVDAEKIADKSRIITRIEKSALEKIISHAQELQYGITFEHLPYGFYIQQANGVENGLYYDPTLDEKERNYNPLLDDKLLDKKKHTKEIKSPYRLNLSTLRDGVLNASPQGNEDVSSNNNPFIYRAMIEAATREQIEQLVDDIYDGNFKETNKTFQTNLKNLSFLKQKNEVNSALDYFVDKLILNNKKIMAALKDCNLDDHSNLKRGLAKIMLAFGADVVDEFIEQLKQLKINQDEYFKQFCATFLNDADLTPFVSEEGRQNLQSLIEFKSYDIKWWHILTTAHVRAGATADFNALINAYQCFTAKVKRICKTEFIKPELILEKAPQIFNDSNIKNMIVALDRAQFLIGNDDIFEQKRRLFALFNFHLDDSHHDGDVTETNHQPNKDDNEKTAAVKKTIDLSAAGAYYASKYEQYHTITPVMNITPQLDSSELTYAYPSSGSSGEIKKSSVDDKTSFEQKKQDYYRYIGRLKEAHYLYPTYEQLEATITELGAPLNNPYPKLAEAVKTHEKWQGYLLELVLISLTKPRSKTTRIDHEKELTTFLSFLEKTLDSYSESNSDAINLFDEHIFPKLLELRHVPDQAKPTLSELVDFYQSINRSEKLEKTDNLSQFFDALPQVLKNYGNSIYKVKTNIDKRKYLFDKNEYKNKYEINPVDISSFFAMLERNVPADKEQAKPQMLQKIARVLSLTSDSDQIAVKETKQLPNNAIADLTQKLIDNTNHDFNKKINANINDKFCDQFLMLNLYRSARLPTVKEVGNAFDSVNIECQKIIKNHQNDVDQNATLKLVDQKIEEIFRDRFKNTVFGNGSVEETKYDIIDVIKEYLRNNNFKGGISKIRDMIQERKGKLSLMEFGYSAAVNTVRTSPDILETDVKNLEAITNSDENAADSEKKLFARIKKTDEDLRVFLAAAKKIGDALSGIYNLNGEIRNAVADFLNPHSHNEGLTDEFLQKQTLLVLLRNPIKQDFLYKLDTIFQELSWDRSELKATCADYLGSIIIDEDYDIEKSIKDYADKFQHIIELTNCLIKIKNNDEEQFRSLQAILDYIIANDNAKNKQLTVEKLSKFIAIIQEDKTNVVLKDFINCDKEDGKKANVNQEADKFKDFIAYIDDRIINGVSTPVPKEDIIGDLQKTVQHLLANHKHWKKEYDPEVSSLFQKLNKLNDDEKKDFVKKSSTLLTLLDDSVHPDIDPSVLFHYISSVFEQTDLIDLLTQSVVGMTDANINSILFIVNKIGRVNDEGSFDEQLTADKVKSLWSKLCLLPRGNVNLSDIAGLYKNKPYPLIQDKNIVESLFEILNLTDDKIKSQVDMLDLDPIGKGQNLSKKSERELNFNITATIAKGIRQLMTDQALSAAERKMLGREFLYINNIGSEKLYRGYAKKSLDQLSRNDLKSLANETIAQLRSLEKQGLNREAADRKSLEVQLVAILREIMFRTTGQYPYTTQIMAVLQSINHPKNLLMQINTGEGKSNVSALLAVMQWVKNFSVDVCTANVDLANRDYQDYKNFFDFLDIPSGIIVTNSKTNSYKMGGINYSTVADLSLYRSYAAIEDKDLKHKKIGDTLQTIHSSLILDEVDYSTLDNHTIFNYTMDPTKTDNGLVGCEWIYKLINDFIDTKEFENVDPKATSVWNYEQDVEELNKFLAKKIKENETDPADKMKQLAIIKDNNSNKLDQWINAACEAKKIFIQQNFAVTKDKANGWCAASPMNGNIPQPNNSFSYGVQQFLHTRLNDELKINKKDKLYRYPIDPESVIVASETSKTFISHYLKHGRIIGFSGTLGSKNELRELKQNLAADILSVPPRNKNRRVDKTIVKGSSLEVIDAIKNQISPRRGLLPHVELLIRRTIPAEDNGSQDNKQKMNAVQTSETTHQNKYIQYIYSDMTGVTLRDWASVKQSFKDIAAYSIPELNQGAVKYSDYKRKIKVAEIQNLEKVRNSVFKNASEIKSIIEKVLNHDEVSGSECAVLANIAKNSHYQLKRPEKKLPQPTLIVCEDSLCAKKLFENMTGVSHKDWAKARAFFAGITAKFNGDLTKVMDYNTYFEPYQKNEKKYHELLLKLKNTIFKGAPEVTCIIDAILSHRDLAGIDLRTLQAISTNSFYQQKRDDFNDFKKIVSSSTIAEADVLKITKKLEVGIFKYHPDIIKILHAIPAISDKEYDHLKSIADKPWYQLNKEEYFEYELVVGEETQSERGVKINRAGNPYTITISTSLLGHGTDIKPKHEDGTLIIQNYLDTKRNTDQIIGRCARNGQPGTYAFIYDYHDILHNEAVQLNRYNHQKNIAAIQKFQDQKDDDEAYLRYQSGQVDSCKHDILKNFDDYAKFIHFVHTDDEQDDKYHRLRKDVLEIRAKIIEDMNRLWDKIIKNENASTIDANTNPSLSASNPERVEGSAVSSDNVISETNIMASSDLQKSYDDLDKCLNRYKKELNVLWEGYREDIVNRYHLPDPENFQFNMSSIATEKSEQPLAPRASCAPQDDRTQVQDQAQDQAQVQDKQDQTQDQAQPSDQLQLNPQNAKLNHLQANLREQLGLNELPHFEDKDNEYFKEIDKQLNCLDIKDETSKLLNYLADNLKWAQKKKSFGYFMERKVIRDDANNILKDVMSLKNADLKEADTFLDKINTLEIKMKHYQSQTRKLWSLNSLNPFGHTDVRKVFDQGLLLINDIKKHAQEGNEHREVDPYQHLEDSLKSNITSLLSRDHSLTSASPSFKFDKRMCRTELKIATNGGKIDYEITVEVANKNVRSDALEKMGFNLVMPNIKKRQMNEAKFQLTQHKLATIMTKLLEKEKQKAELTSLLHDGKEYDDLMKDIKAKDSQLSIVTQEWEVLRNEITEINSKIEQSPPVANPAANTEEAVVAGPKPPAESGGILARMKNYVMSKAKGYFRNGSSEEEQSNNKIAVEKLVTERDEKLHAYKRKDEELNSLNNVLKTLNAALAKLNQKMASFDFKDGKDVKDFQGTKDPDAIHQEIEDLEAQIDELKFSKTTLMKNEKSIKEKIHASDSQWNKMTIFKRQFSSLEKLQDFEKELCSKLPNRPNTKDDAHPLEKTQQEQFAQSNPSNRGFNQFRLFCNHAWHDTSNKLNTMFKETKGHVNDVIHKDAAKMNQFSIFWHDTTKKCHDVFKKFENNIEHAWDIIRKPK